MPYVHIRITPEGATRERKERLIKGVTDLLVAELDKDPGSDRSSRRRPRVERICAHLRTRARAARDSRGMAARGRRLRVPLTAATVMRLGPDASSNRAAMVTLVP